ncbi:MAG: recombinase family protein [Prevotella sp.]|nr:recombinase family protein [Prevotella sp.]
MEKKESIIYGYARVSTKKQSLKMQLEELKKFGCEQVVQEKVSALAERPLFDNLLDSLVQGDTLAVWKLDRLGRSMLDLIKIIADLDAKGVKFVSLTENIDTSTSTGRMMLMLFSMMAEYELSIKKERQEATKEIARQSGRLGGRPKGLSREAKKTAQVLKGMYQEQEEAAYKYSISEITAALKISKGTMYKYLACMNVPKRGSFLYPDKK